MTNQFPNLAALAAHLGISLRRLQQLAAQGRINITHLVSVNSAQLELLKQRKVGAPRKYEIRRKVGR